jgi:DNA invertase Pin-like site-specific DNA recombinase
MTLFGYARVSTLEQDLGIQEAALRAAGCQTIRSERKSATERSGRTELQVLLDFLRKGDTLVVTRIDRLARSMKDLQDIVHELKGRGVSLKATEQPIDTSTAGNAGRSFPPCSVEYIVTSAVSCGSAVRCNSILPMSMI